MKVLLSGGGTAGHITPLLAVAEELVAIAPDCEISFIGQKGDKNLEVVVQSSLVGKVYKVRAGKFRRYHSLTLWQNITNFKVNLLNLRDLFLVVIGFFQSLFSLTIDRPDVIFFKGGFVVVPIGYAARLLRIPYMTHDSDPLPGMANKLIAKGAKKNAVVNSSVTAYPPDKTVVTGVPLAKEYKERRGADQKKYKELLGFPTDSILLFVFTGTQGAKIVDDALEQVLPALMKKYPSLHVACVFGRLNEESMNSRYSGLDSSISARIRKMTFIDNAPDYIAAADVVVARAGATSMAEFATIGRACIIIPAEQLTGGHQLMNAKPYADSSSAAVVYEKDLPSGLEIELDRLISDPKLRAKFEEKIKHLAPENSAKNIAEAILNIAKGSKK